MFLKVAGHVRRLTRPRYCTPVAILLVFALLWSQSLGLWHGTVHVAGGDLSGVPGVQSSAGKLAGGVAGLLTRVLSDHDGESDCRLFDQCSHGDAVHAAVSLSQVPLLTSAFRQACHGLAVALWHAQFQARGPPQLR